MMPSRGGCPRPPRDGFLIFRKEMITNATEEGKKEPNIIIALLGDKDEVDEECIHKLGKLSKYINFEQNKI